LHHRGTEEEYGREEKAANRIFRGKSHKLKTEILHSIKTACDPNSGARSTVSFDGLILKRQGKSIQAQVFDSLREFTV